MSIEVAEPLMPTPGRLRRRVAEDAGWETEYVDERLSEEAEAFLDDHSGTTHEEAEAVAEEAARLNALLIASQMSELADHPLDLASVPHADEVLAALPDGLDPLVLHSFFTRARDYLRVHDEPVSVREWLVRGGDVQEALWCAESEFTY